MQAQHVSIQPDPDLLGQLESLLTWWKQQQPTEPAGSLAEPAESPAEPLAREPLPRSRTLTDAVTASELVGPSTEPAEAPEPPVAATDVVTRQAEPSNRGD